MTPELLERARPVVQRLDRLRVGAIQHPLAVASRVYEPDVAQYTQMLGDGGLRAVELRDELADRALLEREKRQDVAPPRFCNRVEGVRGCRRTRHDLNI